MKCAMNPDTCTGHSLPCCGQIVLSAVSSHRSETEIEYHARPVGGLSGELLQELDQHAKSRISLIFQLSSVSMYKLLLNTLRTGTLNI
jgi:hypothetical protein